MNWSAFTSIIRDRISEITMSVTPHTEYSIDNNGLYVSVEDPAGNVLINQEGTFNSGNNSEVIVKLTIGDQPMLNAGKIRPFEPKIPPELRTRAAFQIRVPAGVINATGLSYDQLGRLVESVAASGIKVQTLFEGTFSFSDDYEEGMIDNEKGFANDQKTIGGTFGYVYDPNTENNLPI